MSARMAVLLSAKCFLRGCTEGRWGSPCSFAEPCVCVTVQSAPGLSSPLACCHPRAFADLQDICYSPLKSPVQLCFVGSTHGRLSGEACSVLDRLCVPPQGSISPGPCDFSGGEALQQQWELSHWARAGQLHHEPRMASPVTVPQAPVTGVAVRGLVMLGKIEGRTDHRSQRKSTSD